MSPVGRDPVGQPGPDRRTSDIVVVDKHQRTAVVIDVAIHLSKSNIREKEHEKLEKYQGIKEELEKM